MGAGTSKMVIIVRSDLRLGKGKIASQAAHAAVTLYASSLQSSNPHLDAWMRWGQPKVVLKVDTDCECTLTRLYETAIANNLNACQIFDAGRTQVERGTLTAIGIGPGKVDAIDAITSHLKLL